MSSRVQPLFLLLLLVTTATDVKIIVHRLETRYHSARTLQATFLERYVENGRVVRTEAGIAYFRRPGKMRWEYRSPKEKLFISDGQAVWFYLPAERQLRKTTLRKLDDLRSPLAFLLGKTKLENELRGLSKVVDQAPLGPGNILLRGIPQAMAGQANEVQVEITPTNQITRIVLLGADGATTEFRFADWKENPELSDSRFRFTPPPGVETVEGQLGP